MMAGEEGPHLFPADLAAVCVRHPGLPHWCPGPVFLWPQSWSSHSQNLVLLVLLPSMVALTSTSMWSLLWSSIWLVEFLRDPRAEVLVKLVN